jgi:hypothetical protein
VAATACGPPLVALLLFPGKPRERSSPPTRKQGLLLLEGLADTGRA